MSAASLIAGASADSLTLLLGAVLITAMLMMITILELFAERADLRVRLEALELAQAAVPVQVVSWHGA